MFKIIILLSVIVLVQSNSVFVGITYDNSGQVHKVYDKTVESVAIPLIKREEEVNFQTPAAVQKIKGIAIKDLNQGNAEASITRGGLGFDFVKIKLKSERGSGLKFLIEIFA